jgi:MFS family permease
MAGTRALRGHRDFRRLWTADLVSQFGDRVTALATPLLAATALGASAFEVSLLRAVQTAAYLALGLQMGAWCDRLRTRPLLIGADLGRAAAFASVPVAAAFGALTMAQLYVVVGVAGILTVVFQVAHRTYLPRLVEEHQLVAGNARLEANISVAAVAGPSASGFLLQYLGGPAVLAVNALRRRIGEGLRFVAEHPVLRVIAASTTLVAAFQAFQLALAPLFLLREIHLTPGAIGLVSTAGLTGSLAGAAVARRLGERWGTLRTVRFTAPWLALGYLLTPLTAPGSRLFCYPIGGFMSAYAVTVINILLISYQQVETPAEMRGRVSASTRFLIYGFLSAGTLIAGIVAESAGLYAALWTGSAGVAVAAALLVFARVFRHPEVQENG